MADAHGQSQAEPSAQPAGHPEKHPNKWVRFFAKSLRAFGRRYSPRIADAIVERLPADIVHHADAWGGISDLLGLGVSELSPDTGFWGLIGSDLGPDFIGDIGRAVEKRGGHFTPKPAGHPTDVIVEDDKQYARLLVALVATDENSRNNFIAWFDQKGLPENELTLRQQSFLRMIAPLKVENLDQIVKTNPDQLQRMTDIYIRMNPEAKPEEHHRMELQWLRGIEDPEGPLIRGLRDSTKRLKAQAVEIRRKREEDRKKEPPWWNIWR